MKVTQIFVKRFHSPDLRRWLFGVMFKNSYTYEMLEKFSQNDDKECKILCSEKLDTVVRATLKWIFRV